MLEVDTVCGNTLASDALERRRAGRGSVSFELIHLLREPTASVASGDDRADDDWAPRDPIAPPRGIALAVALCVPIWAGIGALLLTLI